MQGVKVKLRGQRVYVYLSNADPHNLVIADVCLPGARRSIARTLTHEELLRLHQRTTTAVTGGRVRELGVPA